jgi:type VI secretion system protein ImpG
MDESLRRYYNKELRYLREHSGEFAAAFPKIAGRLGLVSNEECADPYVERLMEAFAFLTARVNMKIDAEFPRLTAALLDIIYPGFLAPMPSMTIVQMNPDPAVDAAGFIVPRGSAMHSLLGRGEQTRCEYRSAHDVTLLPIKVSDARYYPTTASLANARISIPSGVRAGIGLKISTLGGQTIDELNLSDLPLFIRGSQGLDVAIYEQLVAHAHTVIVRSATDPERFSVRLPGSVLRQKGFDADEALLPNANQAFDGYRLIQEYFALPQRFLFCEIGSLAEGAGKCAGTELEILVLLDSGRDMLKDLVNADCFSLHCTPVINLFPMRADRILLDEKNFEFQVIPDRTRPMDFEVWQVTGMKGFKSASEQGQIYRPLYTANDQNINEHSYYTAHRKPRRFSANQKRDGGRTRYMGSETYVSIVDANDAPYSPDLKQFEVSTLCTNRDLPLQMAVGHGHTDFDLQSGAPIESIRSITTPSRPHASFAEGDTTWRLVNLLSLNYLTLIDDGMNGAQTLRNLLLVFCDQADISLRHQVEGLQSIQSRPILARLPSPGPITFARGLDISVKFDEAAFEGSGPFLLGAVLERFFGRYVTVNSVVQTRLTTDQRDEIACWPVRAGARVTL